MPREARSPRAHQEWQVAEVGPSQCPKGSCDWPLVLHPGPLCPAMLPAMLPAALEVPVSRRSRLSLANRQRVAGTAFHASPLFLDSSQPPLSSHPSMSPFTLSVLRTASRMHGWWYCKCTNLRRVLINMIATASVALIRAADLARRSHSQGHGRAISHQIKSRRMSFDRPSKLI
jgi:hypothetical protein